MILKPIQVGTSSAIRTARSHALLPEVRLGAAGVVDLPVELPAVVHVELARWLFQVLRELGELLLEELPGLVQAIAALVGIELPVPEAGADAPIRDRVILLVVQAHMVDGQHVSSLVLHALRVGGVPELVVVLETNKLVQEDLTGILVRISAVRGSRGLFDASFAQSTGHAAGALRALVLVHIEVVAVGVDGPVRDALGWARARQGVPNGGSAIVLASAALPIGLVPAHVLRHGQGLHLATNDEAILVVNVLADRRRATTSVVGNESTELAFVRVPEFPSVLHSDLEALDAVDLVFSGSRHDDLVVQIPEHAGEVGRVDVLQRIRRLALRPIHVEALRARARWRRRRRLRGCSRGGCCICLRLLLKGLRIARLRAGAIRRARLPQGELEIFETRSRGQAHVPLGVLGDAIGHGPVH
mmetsp:Transcript_28671/g.82368  ORF Transcript_28671/g.82368 Transcript_28671/m.82368 type:complete len:416 (+) Transcript_28671:200-1447(+)